MHESNVWNLHHSYPTLTNLERSQDKSKSKQLGEIHLTNINILQSIKKAKKITKRNKNAEKERERKELKGKKKRQFCD